MFGGPPVGKLKIAQRLLTARSWAWQLYGVRSPRMATVRSLRQSMILSMVVNVGTDRGGCWKMTVSETMTADVDVLIIVKHM